MNGVGLKLECFIFYDGAGSRGLSIVQRTNTFVVEDSPTLRELADGCARLWNEVNFERRQAYIHYRKFSWYPKHLYGKYAPIIGSATAQQIINKNNEAWRSFLTLKRLEARGELPPHITRVSMPRYWKRNGRRELRIIVRRDCYRLKDGFLHLPKGLILRIKGRLKWMGRQGRLEIIYDDVDEVWRGFMTVKVDEPPKREGGKPLYIDLGVINLATVWFEGLRQPIAFSGRSVLADWWYWTKKIAKEQRRLAMVNKARTSKRLRRLFRIRKRRFRHAVNAMVKAIVDDAAQLNISKIILGDLRGIRKNNRYNGKANSMVHNFWSHAYIIQRFREKAEEYGIKVDEVGEQGTSSLCPNCGSNRTVKRGRLFKCLSCGVEAHRDAVGVLNIGLAQGASIPAGAVNGLMAQPLLLRWDGMRWEPKRAMNTGSMSILEAETESAEMMAESRTLQRWEDVNSPTTRNLYRVEVDFITEPEGAERLPEEWLIPVQRDLKACIIEGSSIVFKYNYEVKFRAVMPGDGEAAAAVYSADIVGSLTMKGLALYRMKDKDSYDIYAVAGFYNGDPKQASKAFIKRIKAKKGPEKVTSYSLEEIKNAFASATSQGPTAVARFIGTEDARIDSYQRIKAFLESINS